MTDATCFLVPPEPDAPFDHSRKVECRALVPVGHPRIALTQELAEKICDLVAGGRIGDMEGMPSRATIRRWIAENEEFRRAYALAKEGLVEDILEEINEIADDATNDYGLEEGADGTPVVREKKETIARATLRIATKFKLIGKVAPHKYGDVPPAWHRQLHPSSRAKAPAPRSWTVKSSRSSSTSVRLGGLAQGGEGSEMKHGQGTSRPSLFDGQGSSWT
jgi:Bacteriophage Sf6, terminase small subunit-like